MSAANRPIVVLISADAEWDAAAQRLRAPLGGTSPFGGWLRLPLERRATRWDVVFFQGGWGKISAAASTQYAIDHFHPSLLINLGTCGGFAGAIAEGEVVLAEQTLVYDILEQMGDANAHLAHYAVTLDLTWLREPFPQPVVRTRLLSADRDLLPPEVPLLQQRYNALAGDWESGAIAFVAKRNQCPCLILRQVTDLVSDRAGQIYGDLAAFQVRAARTMQRFLQTLPDWLLCVDEKLLADSVL